MRLEIVRSSGWEYASWRPPELAGFVDHLWAYRGPTAHPRKRVFPTGCIELLVNLAEPYRVIEGGGDERLRHVFVGGMQTGSLLLEQPAWQDCVAARLRPAGARALLGCPLDEITGLNVDLGDLLGAAVGALAERCAAARDAAGKLGLLAAWLRGRFARAPGSDPAIAWAAAEIERSGGAVSIASLVDRTSLAKAKLAAAFRDRVGVAPKRYGRIIRLHRALGRLQRGDGSLAEIAYQGRFYDQAHMNAEFRALAGVTPRQFLALRHPVGDGSTAVG
jgi:AraC-like DNA-binding protein